MIISFAIAALGVTTFGRNIENKFGLPLHFKLRGPIQPPENIFILTPYKKTKIGQKTLLRDWDRAQHAQIIEKLTAFKVSQIAIDIFFREYQNEKNDTHLTESLKDNQNVIINQFASKTQSGIGEYVLIRNPIEIFSQAVGSLAPSLLVDTAHRKDAFYPFYSVINSNENENCFAYPVDADLPGGALAEYGQNLHYPRVSTLPLAVLEQFLINSNAFNGLPYELDQYSNGTKQPRLCDFFYRIREGLLNEPESLQKLSDSQSSPALKSWLESLIYLKNNLVMLNNNPGIYLNFYGQPQTIPTISYEQFNSYYEQHKNNPDINKFNNAIVFIGGSFEVSDEEKQDSFETAMTENNNKMSGVEITATAFANLLNNEYLRKFTNKSLFLATLFCSLIVFALATIKSERLIVLLITIVALTYIYVAVQFFQTKNYWLPIVMPLTGMALSSMLLFATRFMRTHRHKEALKSYIPSVAVSSVETAQSKTTQRQATKGVCMVTDVQDFTQISESVTANEMADLVDEYFSVLNQCVAENMGEVYLIDGDSLTAVWIGQAEIVCDQSANAALSIIEKVKRFNKKYPDTPFHTRIGMDFGEFVLGNIGNKSHYTFAVVGNTVYSASRLEQYNKQTMTKILVTNNIEKNLTNFETRDLGEVQFKGKNKLTRVYELIGPA